LKKEFVMGKVQGVKEKLHYPIYDAFFVPAPKDTTDKRRFQDSMTDPRMIRFFVDVQNKTRLETNLQASGVLPSLNTFEARAMRVVVSSPEGHRPIDSQDANEAGFLTDLIYSSVTTLLVGEKIMIEMPTFFFPSGAGVSQGTGSLAVGVVLNHGQADPMSTFRFAEPVIIEPQQNFRVEISFPQGVPGQTQPGTMPDECKLAGLKGPFRIWVVLDGYLTRDVQ
jgi:hypothetical protein